MLLLGQLLYVFGLRQTLVEWTLVHEGKGRKRSHLEGLCRTSSQEGAALIQMGDEQDFNMGQSCGKKNTLFVKGNKMYLLVHNYKVAVLGVIPIFLPFITISRDDCIVINLTMVYCCSLENESRIRSLQQVILKQCKQCIETNANELYYTPKALCMCN